jgi:hypothetical protein
MPNLPVSIDPTARRMDAVIALFGPRSRDGALDPPRAPTSTRPRRVAAFIGATQSAGRAGRLLPARAVRQAPRPAITADEPPPRGPSSAENLPARDRLAAGNSDHPLGRSPTHQ